MGVGKGRDIDPETMKVVEVKEKPPEKPPEKPSKKN